MSKSTNQILPFHLRQYIYKNNKDMMTTLMICVFVLGYLAIALEHKIKIDKAASALIIGGVGWALFAFTGIDQNSINHERFPENPTIFFFFLHLKQSHYLSINFCLV